MFRDPIQPTTMRHFVLFYIPLVYLFRTRPHAAVSLFFTHLLPIVFLYGMQIDFTVQTLALSLSALWIVQYVYDVGYIQNDTETIKKEKNPTRRFSEADLNFYYQHRYSIYLLRGIMTFCFIVVSHLLFSDTDILYFCAGLLLMMLIFWLYNNFRGHIRMFLYFILSSLRYIVPFLLFYENVSFALVILLLMIHPFVRAIEFKSSKPPCITTNIYFRKYIIHYDVSRLHGFRVFTYIILCLIAAVLCRISFFPIEYVWIMLYILAFRVAIYLFYKIRQAFRQQ